MSQEIAVIVKDGQNIVSTNTVMEGSGATGRPLIVKAGSKQSVELKNVATQVAPDQIHVTKDGKNLKIKLGKKASAEDDSADIIIEGYYDNDASLIGIAENGQYYNYIPQGTNPDASYYSLGGDVIGEATETDWLPIALALLGAGALAALAGGGGGGGGDHTAPDSLTVALNDDEAPIIGAITAGTETNDATPVISGVTEAGATVTAKDDAGNPLGTATADNNGDYTIIPSTPLSDGTHYISVTATDAAGNAITKSTVIFKVDIIAPNAPVLNPTDGSPITGIAEPGSTVTITDSYGNLIGTTTANQNGNFSYTPTTPVPHNTVVEATATDAAGNESLPGTTTVNSATPDAPIVIDNVGDITGPIANNSTTDDTIPTITGSNAGANQPINVYDNGSLLGATTSDANGNWSLEPNDPFDVGSEHSISYTINGGPQSPDVNFTIEPPEVIDLGDDGQLIHPVFVDGNWYYYWDRDGDGDGVINGASDLNDWFTHDELDAIFMYDVNGDLRPGTLHDTTDDYRYAELGGYDVALPTYGAVTYGVQAGTAIDNVPAGEINPTYDDLVAIWDAFNGNGTTVTTAPGMPDGWSQGIYWSATQYDINKHYTMDLTNGLGATNGEHDTYWVAVQVIF